MSAMKLVQLRELHRKPVPQRQPYRSTENMRHRPDVPLTDEQRELIEKHMRIINYVVRKRPACLDEDEARSEAMLAVCRIIGDWNPGRGKLSTWLSYKLKYMLIDAARSSGFIKHRRSDTDDECRTAYARSLDAKFHVNNYTQKFCTEHHDGFSLYDFVPNPIDSSRKVDRAHWHDAFWHVVSTMSDDDQTIVRGTVEGLHMKEIGYLIGVCESRVSQMRIEVFEKLRARLQRRGLDGGPDA